MNVLQIETMIYQDDQDDNIHNHDQKSDKNDTNIQRESFTRPTATTTIQSRILIFFHMEEFIWLIHVNLFGRLDHPFQLDKNFNCNKKVRTDEHDNFIQKYHANISYNWKTIDKLHEMGAINQLLTKQNDNKNQEIPKIHVRKRERYNFMRIPNIQSSQDTCSTIHSDYYHH